MHRAGSIRPAVCALALLPAVLLLASCQKDTDPGPGGVTVGEARALDEAAQMLEQRPAPPLVDATVPAGTAPVEMAPAQPMAAPKPQPKPKQAVKPKPKPKP